LTKTLEKTMSIMIVCPTRMIPVLCLWIMIYRMPWVESKVISWHPGRMMIIVETRKEEDVDARILTTHRLMPKMTKKLKMLICNQRKSRKTTLMSSMKRKLKKKP